MRRRAKHTRIFEAVVLFVALAGACKGSAPPAVSAPESAAAEAPAPADPCPAICEHTRPLGCKRAAACAEACGQMRESGACTAAMAAVLDCLSRQPLAHWECNEDGDAAIKEGFCDEQQGRVAACLQNGEPIPKKS